MTFENTTWLYLTPVFVLLLAGMVAFGLRRRDALLGKFAAARLVEQLTEKASRSRTLIKALCVLLAFTAICLALARPQYGVEWSERKARGLDIVFVLDSSKSMLATDMRPTRIDRAKLAVFDLMERLESDRIGLVAFAGRAFLQTPPTLDYAAFRESLESIDPGIMTRGGSDLGNALNEAGKAFPKDNNVKVVVLLTDGEDLGGNAIKAAQTAAENGITVYAIGIGTPEGEYLRIRNEQGNEEFIRDASGQPVRSQLDEATLLQVAQLTGGSYTRLSAQSLDALYSSVLAALPREERESELQETRIERFQWAIAAALIFLVLEILIRRRSRATIQTGLLCFALFAWAPNDAVAQDAAVAPPQTTDARVLYNQAYQALSEGELETAKQLYQSAISATDDLNIQRDALYNLGHANFQSGHAAYKSGQIEPALEQIKEAENLFKSTLEIDPNDPDAAYDLKQVETVRKAIEAILNQQKEQQPQQSDQSDSNQDPSQSSEDQQSENQDGQDQEPQSDPQQQENQEKSDDPQNQDNSGQDPQDSSEQQNSEGQNEPSEGAPSEQPNAPENQGGESESTQDPADDIPEPDEASEGASDEDNAAPEQPTDADPAEGSPAGDSSGAPTGAAMPVEGMTEAEAQALLESLRDGEKLLPFVEQSTPGNRNNLRDW